MIQTAPHRGLVLQADICKHCNIFGTKPCRFTLNWFDIGREHLLVVKVAARVALMGNTKSKSNREVSLLLSQYFFASATGHREPECIVS